jgi:hypothetical protein
MKKYFTGFTFLAVTLCFPFSTTAGFLPNKQSIHLENPIHVSDSDGFVSSELTPADVSKSVNLGFNQKRLSTIGFSSTPLTENPISTLNSEFSRRTYYRYKEMANEIKIGISIVTPIIEYKYCTSADRAFRGGLNQIKKFWVAQLGYHLWAENQKKFSIGIKRGYTIDHFDAGIGILYTTWVFSSPSILPCINLGFTTLGLKNRMRFNFGVGFPEFIYIGTSYSL